MYLWAPVWDCERTDFFLEWQIEEKVTVCTENLCEASHGQKIWALGASTENSYRGEGFKSERKGRKETKMKRIVLGTPEVKNCKSWFLPLPLPGIVLHPWGVSDSDWHRESWRDREVNICRHVFRISWMCPYKQVFWKAEGVWDFLKGRITFCIHDFIYLLLYLAGPLS